ncbi:MAG: hypothetical protein LBK47_08675 [Prevotellaceae bacterium]|jgi:hypothetical protein|nr:hypothetical protein [Prevotellaceae bacterium]
MISILKKNPVIVILTALLCSAALWMGNFLDPTQVSDDVPMMPLEFLLIQLVELNPLASTLCAFVFMYALAMLLLRLSNRNFVTQEAVYLPSLLFILICSAFPAQKWMNGAYVAALFFMAALSSLFSVYRGEGKIYASLFYAGFCLSLASLFSAPAVFLLLLLPVALLLFRSPFQWREWVVALVGTATPLLYAGVGYYILLDDFNLLFITYYSCLFSISNWIFENGRPIEWIYLVYILLVILQAILMIIRGLFTSKVKVQKIHTLLLWAFFVLLVVSFVLPSGSMLLMPVFAIPASILAANYFALTKFRTLASIELLVLMVLTFLTQFL